MFLFKCSLFLFLFVIIYQFVTYSIIFLVHTVWTIFIDYNGLSSTFRTSQIEFATTNELKLIDKNLPLFNHLRILKESTIAAVQVQKKLKLNICDVYLKFQGNILIFLIIKFD